MLFKTRVNCQIVLLNVTQSDNSWDEIKKIFMITRDFEAEFYIPQLEQLCNEIAQMRILPVLHK